jgi:P2 family phage contractile tail tube protein
MSYDKKYSRLTNGNLFVDGNNMYAKVEEITNPEVKASMSDHKVLGGIGKIELPNGYDKMEASFKLNGPLDEIAAMSANVKSSHEVIFRGSVEGFSGQDIVSERPYVCIWRGTFKNSPGGAQKQHENVELMYTMNITYYKLMINGVSLVEIDIVNNILKVNGVDLLAKYRANLGL